MRSAGVMHGRLCSGVCGEQSWALETSVRSDVPRLQGSKASRLQGSKAPMFQVGPLIHEYSQDSLANCTPQQTHALEQTFCPNSDRALHPCLTLPCLLIADPPLHQLDPYHTLDSGALGWLLEPLLVDSGVFKCPHASVDRIQLQT